MPAARAVAAALLVALAACGVTVDSPPPTAAELQRALLSLEDVGEGYTDVTGEDDDDSDDLKFDEPEECRELTASFEETADEPLAEVKFEDPNQAGIENAYELRDVDGESEVDSFIEAAEACSALPFDGADGFTGELRLSAQRVDGLGDEALELSFEIEFTSPLELTLGGVGYYWRRDDVLASVTGIDGIDEDTIEVVPLDEGRIRELAGIADRRLADVLDG